MRRIIREEEPVRPSVRISTLGAAAATVSASRQTDPYQLRRLIRGDLGWIVMKALEKDRNRRYDSASAFASDIKHYLADEPVQACPPSVSYRPRKFVRRNRGRLTAVAVLGVAVLVALGGIGWAVEDRLMRRAKTANDLDLALDRAGLFQGQGKREDTRAALDQAELLASEGGPDAARDARLAALKERLAADAQDQAFIARFDEIRLGVQTRVDVERSQFTSHAAFPEIRDALRQYEIEVGVTPVSEAAARLARPKPVRQSLIAALDECARQSPKEDGQLHGWLLATLATSDNDPWRLRVRQAAVARTAKTLEQLSRFGIRIVPERPAGGGRPLLQQRHWP
jgi:hypothetical protein